MSPTSKLSRRVSPVPHAGLSSPASHSSALTLSDGCPAPSPPTALARARSFTVSVSAVSSALHVTRRTRRPPKQLGSSAPNVSLLRSSSSPSPFWRAGTDKLSTGCEAQFDALVNSGKTVTVSLTPKRLRTLETRARASSSPPSSPALEQPRLNQLVADPTGEHASFRTPQLPARTPTLRRNSAPLVFKQGGRASVYPSRTARPPSPPPSGAGAPSPEEPQEIFTGSDASGHMDPRTESWGCLSSSVQKAGLAWERALYPDTAVSSSPSLAQSDADAFGSSVWQAQDMEVLVSPRWGKEDEICNGEDDSQSDFILHPDADLDGLTISAAASNDHTLSWEDGTTAHGAADTRSVLATLLADMDALSTADECRALLKSTLLSLQDEQEEVPHPLERRLHRSKTRLGLDQDRETAWEEG